MNVCTTCTLPTGFGELYEVPVVAAYDPDMGTVSLVSARIGDLLLTADQVAAMCGGLGWIEKTMTEFCHDHHDGLVADESEYWRGIAAE